MRAALIVILGFAFVLVTTAQAQEKKKKGKEVTLEGTITCAKCDLGKEDSCMTVIVVKEKGKDVVYYFDKKTHKAQHGQICKTPKKGTVTGVVSDMDDKKIITASKVEFKTE